MPELPDITVYVEALEARILGRVLRTVRRNGPFLLRTAVPPLDAAIGREITEVRRVGKRIALATRGGPWLVLHLMIAGRLHWRAAGAPLKGKNALAAFDFDDGSLVLTEAGSKRRASLHVVDDAGLAALDPGGLEVAGADPGEFAARLTRGNHTLKRALTDPRLLSGIGNAYSDEILHRAGLSPVGLTQKLAPGEMARLQRACEAVLAEWTGRLRAEAGEGFPEKVTAFRPEMAVHGKFGQPCPVCGTAVQRIRYASNETNYCPRCQTGGRVLADRALSRLLKKDWPRTIEELEEKRGPQGPR
ncbi:MAG: formamidopyrimidine-DNA glycosylase [Hyphomicrobiales bacterium]|nr:formamidopyrimidine-DNA glycosylase [Hyphomicrobiales bacterium]MCP5372029.1 formamidopyrimidine-DNA glycosylase [Hyphomicrobiales bacterium]